MNDFLERLELEYSDLENRWTKLDEFMRTSNFFQIHQTQQYLLRKQFATMLEYMLILRARIEHIKTPL